MLLISVVVHYLAAQDKFQAINRAPENNLQQVERKIRLIQQLGHGPVFRCNIWRELARLERLRGNDVVAAAYELRLMRLVGNECNPPIASTVQLLEKTGFKEVADLCTMLYGEINPDTGRIHEYLNDRYRHWRVNPAPHDWQLLDDARRGQARVSVIVSLYNAAHKLRRFLSALSLQTLLKNKQVELILIDSASPTNEYEVLRSDFVARNWNYVYGRSRKRETIQAAWNRGIALARAPYLVFLGVDETLYPEALGRLASELDSHPEIDWVMANSLVTEVDENGVFKRDVMPYDRSGGTKDYAYLETCYLSWVGGMYRRSVHERFGYYDETFRASGDTEFKNRLLPHIKVQYLPETLGIFWNYPDDRTTASPAAEIEDTRAWYVHRSLAGVRYAFGNRDEEDVFRLFCAALGYRKSYCSHVSTDIEYASHLLHYFLQREPSPHLRLVGSELAQLLDDMRQIDWTSRSFARVAPGAHLARASRRAARLGRKHSASLGDRAAPTYKIMNDNRYEQHFWFWKSSPE